MYLDEDVGRGELDDGAGMVVGNRELWEAELLHGPH